jgi:uncharacterized protein
MSQALVERYKERYKAPGVYVEEIDSGPAPVKQADSAILAVIGYIKEITPPAAPPQKVTSWREFLERFPEAHRVERGFLRSSVYGFFLNGGRDVYVVPVVVPNVYVYDLKLMSLLTDVSGIPAEGKNLVVVAALDKALYFRIFDGSGTKVVDTDEKKLTEQAGQLGDLKKTEKAQQLDDLKKQLGSLWPLPKLTRGDKDRVITAVTSIVGHPIPNDSKGRASQLKTSIDEAIDKLRGLDDVTLVIFPDLHYAENAKPVLELKVIFEVERDLVAHCASMKNRFAVLDLPNFTHKPADSTTGDPVVEWVNSVRTGNWTVQGVDGTTSSAGTNSTSAGALSAPTASAGGTSAAAAEASPTRTPSAFEPSYGAAYFPWLVADAATARIAGVSDSDDFVVPPSGHIAGVFARVDITRGVHRAPANEPIQGVKRQVQPVTQDRQKQLNPKGVNCIRTFPGETPRIWGARTLSADQTFKYVNIRRFFANVEDSIVRSLRFAVFSPNNSVLWAAVRRDLTAFLTDLWREGALFGPTADKAFYVKCDEQTNPKSLRDAGFLVVEVGLAPVTPAEFIVVQINQFPGGSVVNEGM